MNLNKINNNLYSNFFKIVFDYLFSLILIPFALLIIFFSAILIFIEDKGPVFFVAWRLGKNKKIFKMYKLRSMRVNSKDIRNKDLSTYNSRNDPRLTKIGKILRQTSLDEIPQLLNVIKGDMSIIGPRPDLPEALEFYTNEEISKLNVKPGITGFSQAFYRNSITQKEKFKNDLFYVNNISFFLDLRIILTTIINVCKRKNINFERRKP